MIAFSPKPQTGVHLYTWEPPLAEGDAIASYTLTPTGIAIDDDELVDGTIKMFLSGGTNGTTGSIAAAVQTEFGETLVETIYVPIVTASSITAVTGQELVDYALRPIVGIGASPTTAETNDALEWLNDMLAMWAATGADVGATFPIVAATVIYAPEQHLGAIKNNLRLLVAEQYGRQVAPETMRAARQGLQQVKWANLPEKRKAAEYF